MLMALPGQTPTQHPQPLQRSVFNRGSAAPPMRAAKRMASSSQIGLSSSPEP
jgi:hypothetical protein